LVLELKADKSEERDVITKNSILLVRETPGGKSKERAK